MKNVLWNIDTVDWSTPGTGAIIARASAAGAGSIVLMHDGGGPRGQTVAALPQIISNLRSRGLRLVTVTKLLGNRFFYRPR
jgi:peptidoglycan/xylan/chitin deacetylase (PgdA/CDA1 family)